MTEHRSTERNIRKAWDALRRPTLLPIPPGYPQSRCPVAGRIRWCAGCRRTISGLVLGENQRLPVWEALRAVTSNAAYALFEEGQKGTLSPGKRADLVLLDRDEAVRQELAEGEQMLSVTREEAARAGLAASAIAKEGAEPINPAMSEGALRQRMAL